MGPFYGWGCSPRRHVWPGSRRTRRGTSTVEFAICLPVLLILLLGTTDLCALVSLQQSIETSAYEGIRVASAKGTTTKDVVSRCQQMLRQRGVRRAIVQCHPVEIAVVPPGELVELQVSAPCDSVGFFFGPFCRGRRATAHYSTTRNISTP